MLHEIYNITISDMQELMNSLAHPSMEYAVQQEERNCLRGCILSR